MEPIFVEQTTKEDDSIFQRNEGKQNGSGQNFIHDFSVDIRKPESPGHR
ncbi:hypothetical protein OAL55_03655 [Verrucomicrobiales bacterium]|jgi:hypothetical protein|nr:hypothetical protein [Verrucomicrobiales bacterium]